MKKGVKLYSFLSIFMVLIYFSNSFILYNGILSGNTLDFRFSLWIYVLIPFFWVVTFPLYVVVYFVITKILFKLYGIKLKNEDYRKLLIKFTAIGFAFDICISIIIYILAYFIGNISIFFFEIGISEFLHNISTAIISNPFSNVISLIIMFIVVFICKYMNYKLNLRYCMSNTEINYLKKEKIALYTTILTIPYFYFIPTMWFIPLK